MIKTANFISFVMVNVTLGKVNDFISDIKRIDTIKTIEKTYGVYDVVLQIVGIDTPEIFNTVSTIRKHESVRSTMTLSIIDYKSKVCLG